MGSINQRERARFGSFEFEPEAAELCSNQSKSRLQEQPARILGILLKRAGHVVTRQELREALWPADTFVDFDHSLNTAIRKLRTALDDSANEPRYIETVARHGYRFVAPVEWLEIEESPARANARSRRRFLGIGIAGLSILILAALVQWHRVSTAANGSIRTIAVLPFASADPQSEYVSDGLAEDVIRRLSVSPSLRVTAPTSSLSYKGREIDARTAGRELGVEAVVTGALRRVNDDYVLRVELVEMRQGSQIWGGEYRQPTERVVLIQRGLVADLSSRLGITPADTMNESRESPAYDLYLRGRYHWALRTREDHYRAIRYFEQAIELDPEFALAYAGLGSAYGTLGARGLAPGLEAETQLKSTAAIEKALSLDPGLAEAWASQAARKQNWDRDFEGAERDFIRAIELNPSYANAYQWYAALLWSTGRMDESRRAVETAWQIDPYSESTNNKRCLIRRMDRRFDEAIEVSRQWNRARGRPYAGFCAETAALCKGDHQAMIDMFRERELHGRGESSRADRLQDAYSRGDMQEFWTRLIEVWAGSESYYVAGALAMAGRRDEAFAQLELIFARHGWGIEWTYVDPTFDALRDDPRLVELARRVGLPQVQAQRGGATDDRPQRLPR